MSEVQARPDQHPPRHDHRPAPALALRSSRRDCGCGRRRALAAGQRSRHPARCPHDLRRAPSTIPAPRPRPVPLVVAARSRRPGRVAREVDQVADAGLRVLEIADVTHSLRARNIDIDLASHGWGTPAWVAGVKAALARAAKCGSRSTSRSARRGPRPSRRSPPTTTPPATELVHGQVDVAGGRRTTVPLPDPVVAAPRG